MSARLPKVLRRRSVERARVDSFVAAIRRSADCCDACAPATIPQPRVELVDGRWQLDDASRARLRPATGEPVTNELPLDLVRLMVRP